ncbi:hypothetical protein VNI00_017511 [Paramarasmius palmivorus]|uniref:ALMS motif domain-containing protein n=1 Tax=Paramarasmius palmivorus TaxID=297713 RepID=A0AAW0B0I0_9AGAR
MAPPIIQEQYRANRYASDSFVNYELTVAHSAHLGPRTAKDLEVGVQRLNSSGVNVRYVYSCIDDIELWPDDLPPSDWDPDESDSDGSEGFAATNSDVISEQCEVRSASFLTEMQSTTSYKKPLKAKPQRLVLIGRDTLTKPKEFERARPRSLLASAEPHAEVIVRLDSELPASKSLAKTPQRGNLESKEDDKQVRRTCGRKNGVEKSRVCVQSGSDLQIHSPESISAGNLLVDERKARKRAASQRYYQDNAERLKARAQERRKRVNEEVGHLPRSVRERTLELKRARQREYSRRHREKKQKQS